MELKAKVVAVEQVHDGVIVVIQQDKLKIPVAEEPSNTDEARFVKNLTRSLKVAGFPVQLQLPCEQGFKTGFWLPMEDYETLGKPTIGDTLIFDVKVEK